jgi:hypothetical protein
MDGREHAPETVFRAQELYCVDRLTYEKVAEVVSDEIEPVAVSTLKRWSGKYEWRKKREELAQAQADIAADTIMARSKLLKALLSDPDPQLGFAVSSMETLAMKQAEAARAGKLAESSAKFELRVIRTKEDAVEAIKEAAELKLNRMLADPAELDFKAVQDVKRVMDYAAALEANIKSGTDDVADESKGLSPETADAIRKQILGIK